MDKQNRIARLRMALAAASTVLVIGCGDGGPPMAEAGGRVLYESKPLAGADVIFISEDGPTAVGQTDEAGNFKLATNGKPGAVIGKHKVSIQAVEGFPLAGNSAAASDESQDDVESEGGLRFGRRWLIPERYGNPLSSGLTAEVNQGSDNQQTFKLSRKP